MNQALYTTIEESVNGLSKIFKDPYILTFVKRYNLNEETKKRLAYSLFRDSDNRFRSLRSTLCEHPAQVMARNIILDNDDLIIKWFIMLHSLSTASDIFTDSILYYIDPDLRLLWKKDIRTLGRVDISDVPFTKIENLISSVIDIDYIVDKCLPSIHDYYYDYDCNGKKGVCNFLLTAGYHFFHNDYIPHELNNRLNGMGTFLACSDYVSKITKEDFYITFSGLLDNAGNKGCLDDLFAMIDKNRTITRLEIDKQELMKKLSANEESIRQQETAGEIISQSFGMGITKEVLEARIRKCNNLRKYLYELESLCNTKLNFLDPFSKISSDSSLLKGFLSKHNVFLSESELNEIDTLEDFLDTIKFHISFIDDLNERIKSNGIITDDIVRYDFECILKEEESVFKTEIDRESVHSLKDIAEFLFSGNEVFKGIVRILEDTLYEDPEMIKFSTSFAEDLGYDQVDVFMFLEEVQDRFGIQIPEQDDLSINTVEDLYNYILHKRNSML